MIHSLFDLTGGVILTIVFGLLFLLESRFSLRKRVESRWKRLITNFIVAMPSYTLLRIMLIPVMVWLAIESQNLKLGLNYQYQTPAPVKIGVTLLLLDYSNFIWHILMHRLPFLWRFHLVHHTDLDLDITTAFRFHFGELIGSVFFRGAVVFLLGASPVLVLIYEIVFEGATQFHHSNWKLPIRVERIINKLIVTPRMHGIHHSKIKTEADSNFSVILSVWDRLHRTIRLNIQQDDIEIGMPAYEDGRELTMGYLLKLPFTKIRKWDKIYLRRNTSKNSSRKLSD
jgi:sterol desaturase/sphingolipid hydroxylase (fatty acid hydroxylase superfamily)